MFQTNEFCQEIRDKTQSQFMMNTNFSSMEIVKQEANVPYDFEKFQKLPKNGKTRLTHPINTPSVWTMDCEDGLIILGCSNGRIEVWDTLSGQLKVKQSTKNRQN